MAKTFIKRSNGRWGQIWYESKVTWLAIFGLGSAVIFGLDFALAGLGINYKELKIAGYISLMLFLILIFYLIFELIKGRKKFKNWSDYIKAINIQNMVKLGLIDVLAVNAMKQTEFIKVPSPAVAPSEGGGYQLKIEKLVGMRDLDLIKETVNSSLVGKFRNLAVVEIGESDDGTLIEMEVEDVTQSKKLVINKLSQLEPVKSYKINVQQGLTWDLSKTPHALIAGDSGSGKTAVLMTLMAQLMAGGANIKIIDPKAEFLFLENILPENSVVRDFEEVLSLLKETVKQMEDWNVIIGEVIREAPSYSLGMTGVDIYMRPTILVMDEVGSLVAGVDRKKLNEFNGYLTRIVQMGRSSLTNVILTTQQPNAQVISTAIRDQLSLRILMGKPSPELKRMVFGDGVDLRDTLVAPYTGFYVLSGKTREPLRFEGIDLFANGFANIETFEKCYKRGIKKEMENVAQLT
jgi:hypothetical protein